MKTGHSPEKISLLSELLYEIKVSEAMSPDVITFSRRATFRQIQQALKENKISGVPIVRRDRELVGIVSIDDVLRAYEGGYIDTVITGRMTTRVFSVSQKYSVVSAVRNLEKTGYGRLPVTESATSRKVVGIITLGDVLKRLLLVVSSIAENVATEEAETISRVSGDASVLPEQKLSFEIRADDFDNAGKVASLLKAYFGKLGVEKSLLRRISIACYEMEMNVIIHSLGGTIAVDITPERVVLLAADRGPGIPDIEQALRPGFTTASEKIRALGFGAGMGLANIGKCADRMNLESSMETGTRLEICIELEKS